MVTSFHEGDQICHQGPQVEYTSFLVLGDLVSGLAHDPCQGGAPHPAHYMWQRPNLWAQSHCPYLHRSSLTPVPHLTPQEAQPMPY